MRHTVVLLAAGLLRAGAQTNPPFDGRPWNISTGNLSVGFIQASPIGAQPRPGVLEAAPSPDSQRHLKDLGLVANEDYIAWGAIEREPGKWDWTQHDAMERALHQAGLKYVAYNWVHFPPVWLRDEQKEKRTLMRCLEHDKETHYLSIFDPRTIEWYDHFYKTLHDHFGSRIDDVYACILGPYGEGNYPLMTPDWVNMGHCHEGYWCADDFGIKAFQKAMKDKYSTVKRLNRAWGTGFRSFADIRLPDTIAGLFSSSWERRHPAGGSADTITARFSLSSPLSAEALAKAEGGEGRGEEARLPCAFDSTLRQPPTIAGPSSWERRHPAGGSADTITALFSLSSPLSAEALAKAEGGEGRGEEAHFPGTLRSTLHQPAIVPRPAAFPTPQAKRRWLDFIAWYHQAIIDFAEQSLRTVLKYFPASQVRMKPGGNARGVNPIAWGTYCPGYAKMARNYGIVLQPADCQGAIFGDKWMGTAYQFYGVTECTEPPGGLDSKTFLRRMFSDASCGARQFFTYEFEQHAPTLRRYIPLLTGRPGDTQIAVYCPTTLYRLGANLEPTITAATRLRELCDFDVLDELLIADGALSRRRYPQAPARERRHPAGDNRADSLTPGFSQMCFGNSKPESQRDSDLRLRVATKEPPWVTARDEPQPPKGCAFSPRPQIPNLRKALCSSQVNSGHQPTEAVLLTPGLTQVNSGPPHMETVSTVSTPAPPYRALILFQGEIVERAILKKIEAFQRAGGQVILTGDFQIRDVEDKPWSGARPLARVSAVSKSTDWLKQLSVALAGCEGFDGHLDGLWTSRRASQTFILNPTEKAVQRQVEGRMVIVEPWTIWLNAEY